MTNNHVGTPPKIDKYEPILTIGTIAQKLSISVQLIRVYEQAGLVLPYKTNSGRRMYSIHDMERLHCIRVMITEYGLNLKGIQIIFSFIPCWELRVAWMKIVKSVYLL
jgi:MerR family transcriptional regulator/heat shock protein HspR